MGSLVYQTAFCRGGQAIHSTFIAAIVNPVAGGGRSLRRWRRAERLLGHAGIKVQTLLTSGPGTGATLARQVVDDGFETVLAVGGDGTLHEVVNGLASGETFPSQLRLGLVPAGSGMDFARSLGLDRTVESAVARVLANRTRPVDIGVVNGIERRFFVNFVESGLAASVVERRKRMPAQFPGPASYLLAAVMATVGEQRFQGRVRVDGKKVYEGIMASVVVANGRYFGAGMQIAPKAAMDDGKLDVVILGDFSRAELLSQLWKIYPGIHLSHPKVLHLQAREVNIEPLSPAPLDLDGELIGWAPCDVTVLPHALRVLC